MTPRVFIAGAIAGIVALGFNFLLRLGGLAAYPPEAGLNWFISVVPASIEEPAVKQLGDLAGQLGLVGATLVAATVYGAVAVLLTRLLARRLAPHLSIFEMLLASSLIPWVLFGVFLFPLLGYSFFGTGYPGVNASWSPFFPLTLLLSQGVFAIALAPGYSARLASAAGISAARPRQGRERREFLEKWGVAGFALVAGILALSRLGSFFAPQIQAAGGGTPIDLENAPAIFKDPRLSRLVDSEVTSNDSFYRVAIDVIDPVVDGSSWVLAVDGLVGAPKSYRLADVKSLPSTSQYTTMECVSNVINGNLVSNANWKGVKLSDLLADVGGAQNGATYVVFRSVDGYSVGIPLSKAMEPDSILSYEMNGDALPVSHGYPLRAVIPGLYGMMSAKWITRITLLDSTYDGYWQMRGWSNDATIFTVAFIVEPAGGGQASLSQNQGSVLVAGYAFAGKRGIEKVELSFDNGATWQAAQLKPALSGLTWVLWAYDWHPARAGSYAIYARATDGQGQVQTSTVTDTFPNGATGYAYITVAVVN